MRIMKTRDALVMDSTTGILPTIVLLAANVAWRTDLVASAPEIMHAFAIAIMGIIMGMGIVDHARVCLAPRKKFKNAWMERVGASNTMAAIMTIPVATSYINVLTLALEMKVLSPSNAMVGLLRSAIKMSMDHGTAMKFRVAM